MKMTGGMRGWKLVGNGIVGGQFIGTLNDEDMIFKRDDAEVMRLLDSGLIIGGSTLVAGLTEARMELQPAASGNPTYREVLTPGATPVVYTSRLVKQTTAGAAASTFAVTTYPNANQTFKTTVTVHQTGGGTGAAGDGASFQRTVFIKNVANVCSVLADTETFNYAIDAGITFTAAAVGATLEFTCQGVAGRNLLWGIRIETLTA